MEEDAGYAGRFGGFINNCGSTKLWFVLQTELGMIFNTASSLNVPMRQG
jgi:hypothetical protein